MHSCIQIASLHVHQLGAWECAELEKLRRELAAAQEEAAQLSAENGQLMAMSNKLRSERDRGAMLLAALPPPSEVLPTTPTPRDLKVLANVPARRMLKH